MTVQEFITWVKENHIPGSAIMYVEVPDCIAYGESWEDKELSVGVPDWSVISEFGAVTGIRMDS